MDDRTQNYTFDSKELRDKCRRPDSLNLFGGILLGPLMEFPFPETHCAYWALLVNAALSKDQNELRFALGLPRGFAKTTLMKLFIVWMIIYTPHSFFLIVSSNNEKAEAVVKDIIDFLSTTNARMIWGNWDTTVEKDTQERKLFKYNDKNIVIAALGAGASIRGLNINNERPSVIICEDIQEKECADSDVLNKKFISWFVGTLLKARSYRRSFVVYIGNMYNEQCLLNKLRQDSAWISLITSAILHNGESVWPQFRTKESILTEYNSDVRLGEGAVFLAEVMNDPNAYKGGWIDLSKIPHYPYDLDEVPSVKYITLDPALGKESSDDFGYAVHGVFDGKPVVLRAESHHKGEEEGLDYAIQLALEEHAVLIAIEDVGFQILLIEKCIRKMRKRGVSGILVVPISPHGTPKITRIGNMLKRWIKGEILVHPRAEQGIVFEASNINPLKTNNKDNLCDASAYGDPVLQEYWNELYSMMDMVTEIEGMNATTQPSSVTNSF